MSSSSTCAASLDTEVTYVPTEPQFIAASPVFPVDDAANTARYYRDKLGFTVEAAYGEPPYYVVVRRDEVRIHFSEREDTSRTIPPCTAYVLVQDADALFGEYRSMGITMFSPPEDQEHGMREFELSDLNGHFLRFGQKP